MKRRDLEKKLAELGWRFERHGGNHDVWTNGKSQSHYQDTMKLTNTCLKKFSRKPAKTRLKRSSYGTRRKSLEGW